MDVSKNLADVSTFFDIVTTPDDLAAVGGSNGLTVSIVPSTTANNSVDITVTGMTTGGSLVLYRKIGNGISAPAQGAYVNTSDYVIMTRNPQTFSNAAINLGDTFVAVELDYLTGEVNKSGWAVVTQFSGGNIVPTPGWGELSTLTVESEAGSATGFTKITWSGYNLGTSASLKYKIADDATPVLWDEVLTDGWTLWNGESEIEAESDKVLTLAVVVTDTNKARAKGTAVVVANDNL